MSTEQQQKKPQRDCPVCDGTKVTPYSPDGSGVCGNCRGTGTVDVKYKSFKAMLGNGIFATFKKDDGFEIYCMNDSIGFDNEEAIKLVEFLAEHITDKIIIVK